MELNKVNSLYNAQLVDSQKKVASFAIFATVLGVGLIGIGLIGKSCQLTKLATLGTTATWTAISAGIGLGVKYVLGGTPKKESSREESKIILGKGIRGEVYKTTWHGKPVAVKKSYDLSEKEAFIKGMIFGNLGVKCMVEHYDYIEHKDSFEGVMEYIEGVTLNKLLADKLPADKKELTRSFLNGCKVLLERGVLPRDLHSNNIMIDQDQQVRFIDFDDYAFVGMPKVAVRISIREIMKICKEIDPGFDTSKFEELANNANLISQYELQELTGEVIAAISAVIDAELEKLEETL
jgi:predicted Ser/Thr protein kinase